MNRDMPDQDLPDERGTMARLAGQLWVLGVSIAIAGMLLPGAPEGHPWLIAVLTGLVMVHAVTLRLRGDAWSRTPMSVHAWTTGIGLLVAGAALYATGGARSYLVPVMACMVLFIGFFFPARYAWPLVGELIVVSMLPLIYDADAVSVGFPSEALAIAFAYGGGAFAMQRLKSRLVDAELVQRRMASEDSLTGVPNRRAFDAALAAEFDKRAGAGDHPLREGDALALLFLDVDDFKQINDGHGHVAGDAVLRELATACHDVVRPGDLFARIGGDEFALVAPGVDSRGVQHVARRLHAAAAGVRPAPGAPAIGVTVAWAAYPADGTDAAALMHAADRRLHADKDRRQRGIPSAEQREH